MLFSMMIATLEDRRAKFEALFSFLKKQEKEVGCSDEVEIVFLRDQGERTIGDKRNALLRMATGRFAAFIDDDDWVSDTYIEDIVSAIRKNENLDCIGFFGMVYFKGKAGGKMYHSITCPNWTEEPGKYFRPPNHLNPIRLEISQRYRFRDIQFSEDHFWSLDLQGSGLLKREVFLGHKPLYIYRCGSEKRGL